MAVGNTPDNYVTVKIYVRKKFYNIGSGSPKLQLHSHIEKNKLLTKI